MRRISLSPATYRKVTLVAAILLAIIIVTGASVRLTKSGLGCPVGISCPESQLQAHGPSSEHATIEHVNRLFTGLVSVAVMLAVLGSLVRKPRRRDLVWLSWGLVGGVFAQIVLGQIVVALDLAPYAVIAHFLVSIALLTNAVVLYVRAGVPDELVERAPRPVVSARVVMLERAQLALAGLVLLTGTVVTGSGPHSGGNKGDDVTRIDVPISDAARVHGTTVMIFLGVVIATVLFAHRDRAPRSVVNRLTILLIVLVAQAAIGYVQYFNDIPALLVGFHVAGATAVWTAVLWAYLGLFDRGSSPMPGAVPVSALATT